MILYISQEIIPGSLLFIALIIISLVVFYMSKDR